MEERVAESVVAEASADAVEVIVAFFQREQEIGQAVHLHIGGCAEAVTPGIPGIGVNDRKGFVRTKSWIDPDFKAIRRALLMPGQIIRRIVRGAESAHLLGAQDVAHTHLRAGQGCFGLFPDRRCGLFIEQGVDAEVAFQLEMCPVVERIAQRLRNGGRPGEEFFAGRCVAGDQAFSDAVAAHGTPFVVITFQPDFVDVFKLPVLRDVLWRQMIVVIQNRFVFGECVIEAARGGCG